MPKVAEWFSQLPESMWRCFFNLRIKDLNGSLLLNDDDKITRKFCELRRPSQNFLLMKVMKSFEYYSHYLEVELSEFAAREILRVSVAKKIPGEFQKDLFCSFLINVRLDDVVGLKDYQVSSGYFGKAYANYGKVQRDNDGTLYYLVLLLVDRLATMITTESNLLAIKSILDIMLSGVHPQDIVNALNDFNGIDDLINNVEKFQTRFTSVRHDDEAIDAMDIDTVPAVSVSSSVSAKSSTPAKLKFLHA